MTFITLLWYDLESMLLGCIIVSLILHLRFLLYSPGKQVLVILYLINRIIHYICNIENKFL